MKRAPVVMDIEALRAVGRYCHWIPVTKGLYKDFFARNYPGWDWNDFIPQLIKRGKK